MNEPLSPDDTARLVGSFRLLVSRLEAEASAMDDGAATRYFLTQAAALRAKISGLHPCLASFAEAFETHLVASALGARMRRPEVAGAGARAAPQRSRPERRPRP